jgi:hypothetical protein
VSIIATNWAWAQTLKSTTKLVLVSLADAADDHGVCWPSIPTVARRCCTSKRTVQRILAELMEVGLLRAEPRFREDRSRSTNRYRLALDRGDRLAPARDTGDRGPVTPVSPPRDGGVTPGTTSEPSRESPPPPSTDAALEPSATDGKLRGGGGDWGRLAYPAGLSDAERPLARALLAGLPVDLAQQVLDELAGRMAAATIRLAPLTYLRALVERAKAGGFTPELAVRVCAARERRRQIETAMRRAEVARETTTGVDTTTEEHPLVRRLARLRGSLKAREGPSG